MWASTPITRYCRACCRLIVLAGLLSACSLPLQATPLPVTGTATLTPPDAEIITDTPAPTEITPPSPTAVPALAPPCPISATRTPPPAAPTYGPDPNNQLRDAVDPHVEICASQAILAVGDSATITALAVDVGLPYYRLSIATDDRPPVEIGVTTYMGPMTPGAPFAGLELLDATGTMSQAEFTLRAIQPGTYTLTIVVNGEVHYGYPGPASWMVVSSAPFLIQVEN